MKNHVLNIINNDVIAFSTKRTIEIKNINELFSFLKTHYPIKYLFHLKQVHSNKVKWVTEAKKSINEIKDYDGLLTNKRNVALIVKSADCVPIFIHTKVKNIVGVLHSGWKGTFNNILKNALKTIFDRFRELTAEDIYLHIGPHIRECHYEVSKELWNKFKKRYPTDIGKYPFLSLSKVIYWQAKEFNIPDKNIYDVGICTYCSVKEFFSFRAEKDKSRSIYSVIFLR